MIYLPPAPTAPTGQEGSRRGSSRETRLVLEYDVELHICRCDDKFTIYQNEEDSQTAQLLQLFPLPGFMNLHVIGATFEGRALLLEGGVNTLF